MAKNITHIRITTRKIPKEEIKCPIGGTVKSTDCLFCSYSNKCESYTNYLINISKPKIPFRCRIRLHMWIYNVPKTRRLCVGCGKRQKKTIITTIYSHLRHGHDVEKWVDVE